MEFVIFIAFSIQFSALENPSMHPVPVPAVHLEVGILPLLKRNPQWSCVASLEGRFFSWDSPDPEQEMTPWFYHGIWSVRTIR